MVADPVEAGDAAPVLARLCWPWSEPRADGTLVRDAVIDGWSLPP